MSISRGDSTSFVLPREPTLKGPILIVEDDHHFARTLQMRLEASDFEVLVATDGEMALEMAREHNPELILTDWIMPKLDGLYLIQSLRASTQLQAIYVIVMSALGDTAEIVKALESGADDILTKSCDYNEFVARIKSGLRIRALQRALVEQASLDPLTNLHNRAVFFGKVAEETQRALRYGHTLTVAMIDLDRFKVINDTRGHLAGDAAIRYAAQVIQENCRQSDVVCRYGGDEFAILFIDLNLEIAQKVLARIKAQFKNFPFCYENETLPFGMSYGACQFDLSLNEPPDYFVQKADNALYAMKDALRKDELELQGTERSLR